MQVAATHRTDADHLGVFAQRQGLGTVRVLRREVPLHHGERQLHAALRGAIGALEVARDRGVHAQAARRSVRRDLRLDAVVHRGVERPLARRGQVEVRVDAPAVVADHGRRDESGRVQRAIHVRRDRLGRGEVEADEPTLCVHSGERVGGEQHRDA